MDLSILDLSILDLSVPGYEGLHRSIERLWLCPWKHRLIVKYRRRYSRELSIPGYEGLRRRIEALYFILIVEECRGQRFTVANSVIESSDAIVEILLWVGGTGIVGRHDENAAGFFLSLFEEPLQFFWKDEELQGVRSLKSKEVEGSNLYITRPFEGSLFEIRTVSPRL